MTLKIKQATNKNIVEYLKAAEKSFMIPIQKLQALNEAKLVSKARSEQASERKKERQVHAYV